MCPGSIVGNLPPIGIPARLVGPMTPITSARLKFPSPLRVPPTVGRVSVNVAERFMFPKPPTEAPVLVPGNILRTIVSTATGGWNARAELTPAGDELVMTDWIVG